MQTTSRAHETHFWYSLGLLVINHRRHISNSSSSSNSNGREGAAPRSRHPFRGTAPTVPEGAAAGCKRDTGSQKRNRHAHLMSPSVEKERVEKDAEGAARGEREKHVRRTHTDNTRVTGLGWAVMCNLINTPTPTYTRV